ncbi:MAG: cyclopropane fatty acyl phospholipid synthase [Candidatus Liptonbacteria bacterium]|nr:cyclopropane fatty acyl phospholipid synthase [Candidatus Liptonbacteria bacterium]
MPGKTKIKKTLAEIDISIDGNRDWDIQVHDERLYRRVILRGSIGLGEAYTDGWWNCRKLDEFFYRILKARLNVKNKAPGQDLFHYLSNLFNKQTVKRSLEVGERHYDIGNDLYKAMLDKRMTYTCGYWDGALTLDEAQENKLDLICRKLNLKAGQKVLDIGCGWGSFAKFAAEKYGANVTGITISKEQVALGKEMTKGLPVDIKFLDYRKIEGMFDHIVSIGMFEHVGHKNYRTFMEVVGRHLKDDGIFLLHTIGGNFSGVSADPWTVKYIFPNGILPDIKNIGEAIEGIFVVEDWHNFGADYDKTLMAWHRNFEANWGQLQNRYSERFHRMWNYFLLSCAGAFRARNSQLWQIVLSKNGIPGGYKSIR